MTERLSVCLSTFNARGLGDNVKRKSIFNWLHNNHKGIIFLQETHSTSTMEKVWTNQWGNKIVFSHGTNQKGGVAILFSTEMQCEFKECITDEEGRILLLDLTLEGTDLILLNIYSPTKDKPQEQQQFINRVRNILKPYIDRNIILGGDFNICQHPEIDKKGGTVEQQSKFAKEIISFQEEFELVDVWRLRHPTLRRFTRRERSVGGFVQSRLDFWLISKHLEYNILKTDISPGRRSDHSVVSLNLELLDTVKRGKGFWKMNTSLLKDEEYLAHMRDCIQQCKEKYTEEEDKRLVWDLIKSEVRAQTISYSIYKCKQRRELEKELNRRLNEVEKLLTNNVNNDLVEEYSVLVSELDSILLFKTKGAILRSTAKWVEEGEKNSSYFLKLEKRNQKLKTISTLITETGESLRKQEAILKEQQRFYQHLYTARPVIPEELDNLEPQFLNNSSIKKLSELEKHSCDDILTLEECTTALKDLPNGKSPGSDGLPAEFYKIFWPEIKFLVFDTYLYSNQLGEMSIDQRRGVITLIPKPEKDLRYLANWRPISLLNTDYKILAKALANRLQTVLNNIIDTDQSGYIKNRYIGDNIRTIADVIDYCKIFNKPGIIALLDFQKAFDSISWPFIHKTLASFNFGDNFQKWIKLLYSNISSCVTNNGHTTRFFPVERGVRQGCPVSPLLFILVAEMLANKVRSDGNIHGINIDDMVLKISQLADDTTLFVSDADSLKYSFKVLDSFAKISGLVLNRKKTKIFCIGIEKSTLLNMGFEIIENSFSALGVWFSDSLDVMSDLNFNKCLEKLKCQLNIWQQRDLSLKGKITILKTLGISKIIYLSSLLYVPDWFIEKVNNLFTEFLWNGKRAKVKLNTIIGEIAEGGLKMPHVDSMIKSLKLTWLCRYFNDNIMGKWKVLSNKILGVPKDSIASKLDLMFLSQNTTSFYKQILNIWYSIYSMEPTNANNILHEHLFANKFILIGNKPIMTGFDTWKQKDICCIQDLINPQTGCLLSLTELSQKYSFEVNIMQYNSLVSAIPAKWKLAIKDMPKPIQIKTDIIPKETERNIPKLSINEKPVQITAIQNKDLYWLFVKRIFRPPTALSRWLSLHPSLEEVEWSVLFKAPYNIIRSTKYQTLQYKILNRIIACKEKLTIWKIIDSDLCAECAIPDTLEHHFFECHVCYTFWQTFQDWFRNVTGVFLKLDVLNVLLGINNTSNDNTLYLMDYCIIIAKFYIYKQKYLEKSISFFQYLVELKHNLEVEKYLLFIEGKQDIFNSKWSLLYNAM